VTRTDKVEVDWQRFDDDTKSSLKGSHVWHALSHIGRAVYPGKLSGTYLRRLLAKMSRTLTLKEIGQQFFKNPAFPMVPSVEDIRRAVFETLSGQECYQPAAGRSHRRIRPRAAAGSGTWWSVRVVTTASKLPWSGSHEPTSPWR
jgi:hypothetical protein